MVNPKAGKKIPAVSASAPRESTGEVADEGAKMISGAGALRRVRCHRGTARGEPAAHVDGVVQQERIEV
jgi:hypothetical protein